MKYHWIASLALVVALLLSAQVQAQAQTPLKVAGAVTLVQKITQKQAEIEAASGQKLDLIGNTTLRGLLDVSSGAADIGLVGGPMEGVLASANAQSPGLVNAAALTITPLKPTTIVFVAKDSNPLKSLTLAQISAILGGKTTNWKDVGGSDQPINLILPPATNGFRIMLQAQLLKAAPFAPAREIPDLKNIPLIVVQLEGAFSFLSTEISLPPGLHVITTDQPIQYPLQLVTSNKASAEVLKTVAAIQAALK